MIQKKSIYFVVLLMIITVFGCASTQSPQVSGPLIYIDTPKQDGSVLKIDVYAKNMEKIAGAQMAFSYNPEMLQYDRSEEGTFLKSDGARTFFFDIKQSTQAGIIKDIVVVRQGAGLQGDGYLASLYFNILKSGSSRIDFEEVIIA